jgi:hypothetical protein
MIVVVAVTTSLQGAGGTVNANGQGEVFKKVLAYDRTFQHAQKIHVFIVGAVKGDSEIEELANGFRKVGIQPTIVWDDEKIELRPNDQIVVVSGEGGVHTDESWTLKSSVVYFLPGIEVTALKQFCTSAGVLSISGTPSLAEAGHVSVSTDPSAGGSQIVVNLKRMREEKHHLSADLLRVARVVR